MLICAQLLVQVQNMSEEDVNRSTLGRSLGGILLLWLASYAVGIPFRYGLAAALLALAVTLFSDWDRRRHGRRHGRRRGCHSVGSICCFCLAVFSSFWLLFSMLLI
jgi:hypothetical protein